MTQNDIFLTALRDWSGIFMRNAMHNTLRACRDHGWSMSQLATLMVIHRRMASAITDIGDELGVSKAAASQMLDRMVQEDLIQRTEDPDDRRVKQIRLSEKGQKMLHESLLARHSWTEDLARLLNDQEKEAVSQALGILIEKANQLKENEQPGCSANTTT